MWSLSWTSFEVKVGLQSNMIALVIPATGIDTQGRKLLVDPLTPLRKLNNLLLCINHFPKVYKICDPTKYEVLITQTGNKT